MTTGTLSFALRFAQLGMAVFPVHEVGKDGRCTCEVYRHTEECKRNHPHMWLDTDEHCPNPGKCPRVRWREKSTVSELQIRRWWQRWPNANVGVDCGKSNLVVVDFDISKPDFDGGDLLDLLDKYPTWQVITGSGGYHYIYKAPAGGQFTNAAGMLPKGCDIRAAGGFIVGAGSLHRSGNRYRFADGFEPKNIPLAELPEPLQIVLHDSARAAEEKRAEFSTYRAPASLDSAAALLRRLKPHRADDYGDWLAVGMALQSEFGDMALHLWDAWSQTSAKYRPNECDRKWRSFGNRGGVTFATLVWMADQDSPNEPGGGGGFSAWLGGARTFVKTQAFRDFVPVELQCARGYRTDSTDSRVADAILDLCERSGKRTVFTSLDELRWLSGVGSKATVKAALLRLARWFVVADESESGTVITVMFTVVSRLNDSSHLAVDTNKDWLIVQSTRDGAPVDYSRDKAFGPYANGVSQAAKQGLQRLGLSVQEAVASGEFLRGLGESILRVADCLHEHGELTRRELSDLTGKTLSSIATATRRAASLGYFDAHQATKFSPTTYRLSDDYRELVTADYARMLTFKIDLERRRRDLADKLARLRAERPHSAQAKAMHLRKIERVRAELVAILEVEHPDWTPEQIAEWADTPDTRAHRRFAVAQRAERQERDADPDIDAMENLTHYRRKAYAMAA